MKKFITKIILFFLPVMIIAIPIDIYISKRLAQTNEFYGEMEVWNDVYNSNINCDLAIYGSSRAWVQIDPEILSNSLECKVYNFGIDGHNFWLQYLRHLEYIIHNPKPKVIVLSLDIFSLQKRKDLYVFEQFLPFLLWNKNVIEYTNSYKGYDWFDYYVPLLRYAGKEEALKATYNVLKSKNQIPKYRKNGYLGMDKKWNNDLEKAKKELDSYTAKLHPETLILLEKFIVECRNNGIQLIMVNSPEHVDGQNFVKNRKEIMSIYKKITQKHHLTFLDYSADPIGNDKNLFYNATHLNKKGAELFSVKLSRDLKKIISQ